MAETKIKNRLDGSAVSDDIDFDDREGVKVMRTANGVAWSIYKTGTGDNGVLTSNDFDRIKDIWEELEEDFKYMPGYSDPKIKKQQDDVDDKEKDVRRKRAIRAAYARKAKR